MRIAVIGGGPAGLYFAILMKRDRPAAEITVVERNQADDTFGFGVVFSDATLDAFRDADEASYREIVANFAYWDDIAIIARGHTHRVGGNGFCGCSRRTLLSLLQARARALGVVLEFRREASPEDFPDADLIIAADGVNSPIRTRFAEYFQPAVDLRPNRFAWMGSTRPLDAFSFFFVERPEGIFIAHAYQYEAGASTWVLETDPETFARAGLGAMSEAESAACMEEVFSEALDGHKLITNRSLWRQFPMIRCARWVKDNVVLLGDAKASAHFSIGSGTKLAMEDAIALHAAFMAGGDVSTCLTRFESARREEVEKIQHAADVSLVWFEQVKRFWDFHPARFAFGVMTRSKAITWDNLLLRAPDFVAEVQQVVAAETPAGDARNPPMFQPFALRGMRLPNRVVVSPMCMYSADDGLPDDFHLIHYGARAMGGAGLIFTEMTCPAPDARITPGCAGLWNDAQQAAWTRIVHNAHAHGAKMCLQLGHAGRKGATKLMWEGMDRPLPSGAWPIIAASPLPYYPESQVPRAMQRTDMDRVKAEFLAATQRGIACGFDMLELHCAHGYLLGGFLSPLTNQRDDEYGGSVENRLRFPLEVFTAMRALWPAERPMSVRVSATDWAEGGITDADMLTIARTFRDAGCDLLDVSTGQTVADAAPIYGRMFQLPWADMLRNEAGIAVMCVGSITTADQVNTIIAAGRADLVALGRPHLTDPASRCTRPPNMARAMSPHPHPMARARMRCSATRSARARTRWNCAARPGPQATRRHEHPPPPRVGATRPHPSRKAARRAVAGGDDPRRHAPGRLRAMKIEITRDGDVRRVTIANHAKLNTLNSALLEQLAAAFDVEPEIRAVVLTGEGERAFIGGADIREMGAVTTPDQGRAFIERVHGACAAIRACRVPVIARIQGWCLGAGLEIAAACDLRIAAEPAKFGMPEVRVGIPSVVEAALLPGLIGWGRTRRLLLLAETLDAATMESWGFLERVVPLGALDDAVTEWLALLRAAGPHAIANQKALIGTWEDLPLSAAIAAGISTFAKSWETDEPRAMMGHFLNRARP